MKLVNNCVSAVIDLAIAEGLAMGLKADLDVLAEVLAYPGGARPPHHRLA